MPDILVTGAAGLVGRWVIRELVSSNESVAGVDIDRPDLEEIEFLEADLKDFGETYQVINQIDPDTVVHLAAIPHAGMTAESVTFENNTLCTYNVFEAATQTGCDVIWTSTIEVHGDVNAKFECEHPPFTEEIPQRPMNTYALSKMLAEEMASYFARTTESSFVTLRPAWVNVPGEYELDMVKDWFEPLESSPEHDVNQHLWAYTDVRDIARFVKAAHNTEVRGHEAFFVVAEDTYFDIKTRDLVEEIFGDDVDTSDLIGFTSMYSTQKAAKKLGWEPKYSWREAMGTSDDSAGQ